MTDEPWGDIVYLQDRVTKVEAALVELEVRFHDDHGPCWCQEDPRQWYAPGDIVQHSHGCAMARDLFGWVD